MAGLLDVEDQKGSVAVYRSLVQPRLRYCPVNDRVLIQAGMLAEQCGGRLRAPDAVHLSLALANNLRVASTDRGMITAGHLLGINALHIGVA